MPTRKHDRRMRTKGNAKSPAILTIAILMIFSLLASCNAGAGADTHSMALPSSGMVKKGVFDEIKESDSFTVFVGQEGSVRYEWLFVGSKIGDAGETADVNLKVNFGTELAASVKKQLAADYILELSFASQTVPSGKPSLSLILGAAWEVDGKAGLYRMSPSSGRAELVQDVLLSNSPTATVNFTPTQTVGEYFLVGFKPAAQDVAEKDKERPAPDLIGDISYTESASKGPKDKYLTDPTPKGKPKPVEPEDTTIDKSKSYTCYLSIRCDTILNNMADLNPAKRDIVPADGTIMARRAVTFYAGESVFDVLQRETKNSKIHMEFVFTPMYNSVYIEGIANLYEFDCGALSGWMYRVDGWFPNYGASRYALKDGEYIEWIYTCDLGRDIGGNYWDN